MRRLTVPSPLGLALALAILGAPLAVLVPPAVAAEAPALDGTSWVLVMLNDRRPLPEPAVTMRFEKGRVSGSDGCNRYMADYGTSPVGFRFLSPTVSTRKACPPATGQQADAFTAAVAKTRRLQPDGAFLHLMDDAGTVLATLKPAPPPAAPGTGATTRLLGGEMTYMADAATFTDCASGQSFPIAMEGAFVDAQRDYRAAAPSPGAPVYVTFHGTTADRPRMDGAGTQPTVVVGRFVRAWPDERCERAKASAALLETHWRIVALGADPVAVAEGRREPHLLLRSGSRARYAATVGCNQLAGGFSSVADRLTFSRSAATMMACPAPLGEAERRLSAALAATRRYGIVGNTMELLDEHGATTLLLQAVALK